MKNFFYWILECWNLIKDKQKKKKLFSRDNNIVKWDLDKEA